MTDQTYITKTELEGVLLLNRPSFADDRGFFREVFRKNDLEAAVGAELNFVQSNHARSSKNTLRGIHIAPWSKLITIMCGEIQAVIVDCRPDSATFGKHISVQLGESNFGALFVPPGFGNSYLVTSEQCDYNYLVTDYWAPGKETSIRYDDPDLNIEWQTKSPILSAKDMQNPSMREAFPEKFNG